MLDIDKFWLLILTANFLGLVYILNIILFRPMLKVYLERESLTKGSLDAAKEIAENNPLGMDEVFLQMRDKVLGRYVTCHGREIDNRLLVNSCERLTFESSEHTALLNRAGGAP